MRSYRYGRWSGGPDPLAPPYDAARALDEMGDSVLAGDSPADALRELLARGMDGRRGLAELRRKVRDRMRSVRRRGRTDGMLEQVRELLDRALEEERRTLLPDPSDDARLAEAELDNLPEDTASAVRDLGDYQWRSPEAAQTYEEIRDLLRREVLDSSFGQMRDALKSMTPQDMSAMREMMSDLGDLIEAHNRGEDTEQALEDFLDKHGQFFPDRPNSVEELVDQLARRAAAQERLMRGLTPEQRDELSGLMSQALEDMGMAAEMARLSRLLEQARPDLPWNARGGLDGRQPMGLGDATSALAELADLEALAAQLEQSGPGSGLSDVDLELAERVLGREGADDVEALQQLQRELERQGYLNRREGRLELTPRAVRRLGSTALRRVLSDLDSLGRGEHDVAETGTAGEATGVSRQWQWGDESQLEVVQTVRNAVLREASEGPVRRPSDGGPRSVRLAPEDFAVVETERRTSAAVALLIDMSYSMALRGTWGVAKQTALALHTLITTKFPQDKLTVIGFASHARTLQPVELAGLSWDNVQGTNLQHGLMLARRHLAKHSDAEPVILVVTDGEPTAHIEPDGTPQFCWPPLPETLAATLDEVDRCTRARATINVFLLDQEPGLVRFCDEIARRNRGRVLMPSAGRLGEFVVRDYLQSRGGGFRRAS